MNAIKQTGRLIVALMLWLGIAVLSAASCVLLALPLGGVVAYWLVHAAMHEPWKLLCDTPLSMAMKYEHQH